MKMLIHRTLHAQMTSLVCRPHADLSNMKSQIQFDPHLYSMPKLLAYFNPIMLMATQTGGGSKIGD